MKKKNVGWVKEGFDLDSQVLFKSLTGANVSRKQGLVKEPCSFM